MEDTLRVVSWKWLLQTVASLNPCFNGRYTQSNGVMPAPTFGNMS